MSYSPIKVERRIDRTTPPLRYAVRDSTGSQGRSLVIRFNKSLVAKLNWQVGDSLLLRVDPQTGRASLDARFSELPGKLVDSVGSYQFSIPWNNEAEALFPRGPEGQRTVPLEVIAVSEENGIEFQLPGQD